jgi:hypothetical protein
MTRKTVEDVVGAERRLTPTVVRTESPGMNPPAGRVGVRDGVRVGVDPFGVRVEVEASGVRVAVGGAGVRVGVAVGTGVRYLPAIQPDPSDDETGTQIKPPPGMDRPVTVTVVPLRMTPRLGVPVLGPVRRLTPAVALMTVPTG